MKNRVKLAIALILMGMFLAACSHYTCPAYAKTNMEKPIVNTKHS